jgi:DNA-binding XRE family transcriptional regulator
MDEAEKERLEARGYWVGDYAEYLGLTEAERQHVELRGTLSDAVRRLRESKGLTQKALGKLIASTQARVAKVETGTVEVSLDLMFRAFFAAGGKLEDLTSPATQPTKEPEAPASKPKAKRLARQGG